jgi:hypothetical protein
MGYGSVNADVTLMKSHDCVEGISADIKDESYPAPLTLMLWFDHGLS